MRPPVSSYAHVYSQDAIGQTALHHAVAAPPQLDCVSLLIQKGGARLRRDTFGCTPLHNAASSPTQATDSQALATVRLLMEAPNAQAMIDAEAAQGYSVLSLAVTLRLKGVCVFLVLCEIRAIPSPHPTWRVYRRYAL